MSTQLAIDAKSLTKQYAINGGETVDAVRGIDLAIEGGEIYAMLGPNGAGKTTTLSMLTTLLTPTGGVAKVAGYDVVQDAAEVRRRIGVTFQEIVLDEELKGRQVLDFHGQLYGLSRRDRTQRIGELAELVELSDVLDRKVGGYSGGMKRRLELARGLMTWPQVLFLDEPTQGLDPHNRAGIWRYIRRLSQEMGITLLLTTHYMEEAEALADRVGIIDHGRLVVEGTPSGLIRQMGADVVFMLGSGSAQAFVDAADQLAFVANTTVHSHGLTETVEDGATPSEFMVQVGVDSGERRLVHLVQLAAERGFHAQEISVAVPTLGDVFLAFTGRELRD